MVAALVALALSTLDMPEKRWIYLATNLLVDKNVDDGLALIARSKKAGYNGVLLSDSKFTRWDSLDQRYFKNVERFRAGVKSAGMELIAAVAPIGYSNDLLSRDPNLAEGLPVVDAPFKRVGDRLVPEEDSIVIQNGGFEQFNGDNPTGWGWVDLPGKVCFKDTTQFTEGKSSLRMDSPGKNNPESGNARAMQKLSLKPFRYVHLAVDVKTQDFETPGAVNITVLGKDGRSLQHRSLPIERTMGWKTIDVTFNTLDSSEVNVYLGVWGGKGGSIWWDNVRVEPGGLVNLVRRQGAPFVVRSDDGKTTYREETDYAGATDPKMGNVAWPGDYDFWHVGPTLKVPTGSHIGEGERVRVSYCHTALIYWGQAMICMAEPKVKEILSWQIAQVHKYLRPDGYMLSHDEIRMTGWDASCEATKKTPGQLLAANVAMCAILCRTEDPSKPVYAWSDMFDPYHNAQAKGPYYLVKGDGPWKDSWLGLDKNVIIVNWNMGESRKKSAEFFASRGHRQILAGYYDGGGVPIQTWLAEIPGGALGAMYTTWENKWTDLESFIDAMKN